MCCPFAHHTGTSYRIFERTLAKKQKIGAYTFYPYFKLFTIPKHNQNAFQESTDDLFVITCFELDFNRLGEPSKDVMNGAL